MVRLGVRYAVLGVALVLSFFLDTAIRMVMGGSDAYQLHLSWWFGWAVFATIIAFIINDVALRFSKKGAIYDNLWNTPTQQFERAARNAATQPANSPRGMDFNRFVAFMHDKKLHELQRDPQELDNVRSEILQNNTNLGEEWCLWLLHSAGAEIAGHPAHGFKFMMRRVSGFHDVSDREANIKMARFSDAAMVWLNLVAIVVIFFLCRWVVGFLVDPSSFPSWLMWLEQLLEKAADVVSLGSTAIICMALWKDGRLGFIEIPENWCRHQEFMGRYVGTHLSGWAVAIPLLGQLRNSCVQPKMVKFTTPETGAVEEKSNDVEGALASPNIPLPEIEVRIPDGSFDLITPLRDPGRNESLGMKYRTRAMLRFVYPVYATYGIRGNPYTIALAQAVPTLYGAGNAVVMGEVPEEVARHFNVPLGAKLEPQAHADIVSSLSNAAMALTLPRVNGLSMRWTMLVLDYEGLSEQIRGSEKVAEVTSRARALEGEGERKYRESLAEADRVKIQKRIQSFVDAGMSAKEAAQTVARMSVAESVGTIDVVTSDILNAAGGIGGAATVAGKAFQTGQHSGSRNRGRSGGTPPATP